MTTGPSFLHPDFGYVLLFRGKGFISQLIRWFTRSKYSHAAILLPGHSRGRGDYILEAWQGAGVRVKQITNWENVEPFSVEGMTRLQWMLASTWGSMQQGLPYDYAGVFGFVIRWTLKLVKKWFCSALVYASVLYSGIALLGRVPNARYVSPEKLSTSPLLHGIGDDKFISLESAPLYQYVTTSPGYITK